jgi:hypothetical protein
LLLLTQEQLSQAAQQAGLLTHMAVAGSYRRDIQVAVLAIGPGQNEIVDGATPGMRLFTKTKQALNAAQ